MQNDKNFRPDHIGAYFRIEWLPLALVTVSGLIYNIGLLATPWFEGRLAQCLADILGGSATAAAMAISKGWFDLVGPALLVGTLGYVLGNYLGVIVANVVG